MLFPSFSLIESPPFVKLVYYLGWRVIGRRRAFLALVFISEALEVVVCNVRVDLGERLVRTTCIILSTHFRT